MSTPPALQVALPTYDKQYDADYATAMKKYDDMVWYEPTEAERKAIVAKQRKGHDTRLRSDRHRACRRQADEGRRSGGDDGEPVGAAARPRRHRRQSVDG